MERKSLADVLLEALKLGHKIEISRNLDGTVKIEAYHWELENGLVTFKPGAKNFKKAANKLLNQCKYGW